MCIGAQGSQGAQGVVGTQGPRGQALTITNTTDIDDTTLATIALQTLARGDTDAFVTVLKDLRSDITVNNLNANVSRHSVYWDSTKATANWTDLGLFNGVDGPMGAQGAQGAQGDFMFRIIVYVFFF